jgi:anti-sigma regulatory factor (Ser/Thr protein kinase)
MSERFQLRVRADADAARSARHAITASYPGLPPATRDDALLLVSELVTNAVLHGGVGPDQPIELELRREGGHLHVRVVDPGTEFARPAPPTSGDSSGGWGLFFVDQIAKRWGVCPAPSGTCVWFELPAGANP